MSGKAFHQVLSFTNPAEPDNIYLEKSGDYIKFWATDDDGMGWRVGHSPQEMADNLDAYLGGDGWRSISVVDAASVTAVGALMDSEVTNLDQVKAFDTANYASEAFAIYQSSMRVREQTNFINRINVEWL